MTDIEWLKAFFAGHNKVDLTELDKLEAYLKENGFNYERIDQSCGDIDIGRHQLIVCDESGVRKWDAICHYGSYGYEEGLLEIMGDTVDEEAVGDTVEGWLTAEEVIKRLQ